MNAKKSKRRRIVKVVLTEDEFQAVRAMSTREGVTVDDFVTDGVRASIPDQVCHECGRSDRDLSPNERWAEDTLCSTCVDIHWQTAEGGRR